MVKSKIANKKTKELPSAPVAENRVLYAVMKLLTEIKCTHPFNGKRESIKIGGIAGYIPVFDNIEEASISSQDGKYSIVAIQPS